MLSCSPSLDADARPDHSTAASPIFSALRSGAWRCLSPCPLRGDHQRLGVWAVDDGWVPRCTGRRQGGRDSAAAHDGGLGGRPGRAGASWVWRLAKAQGRVLWLLFPSSRMSRCRCVESRIRPGTARRRRLDPTMIRRRCQPPERSGLAKGKPKSKMLSLLLLLLARCWRKGTSFRAGLIALAPSQAPIEPHRD